MPDLSPDAVSCSVTDLHFGYHVLITWVIRYLDANERDCFRLNQTGGLRKMMMMVKSMFTVIIIFGFYVVGKSEIYIVTIQGEPVTSYRGGVDGFEATAVDSDETLDVTRIVFFEPFFYKQVLTVPITRGMQFVTHRSGSQEDHIQQPEQSLKKCGREMKEGDQSKLLGGLAASRACYGVLNRYVDPLALKLLERLLAFDPKDRPLAEEEAFSLMRLQFRSAHHINHCRRQDLRTKTGECGGALSSPDDFNAF